MHVSFVCPLLVGVKIYIRCVTKHNPNAYEAEIVWVLLYWWPYLLFHIYDQLGIPSLAEILVFFIYASYFSIIVMEFLYAKVKLLT